MVLLKNPVVKRPRESIVLISPEKEEQTIVAPCNKPRQALNLQSGLSGLDRCRSYQSDNLTEKGRRRDADGMPASYGPIGGGRGEAG